MPDSVDQVMALIQKHACQFVDYRFTDTLGKEHHVSIPVDHFNADSLDEGHPFDGSSMPGWKGIEASDMLLLPDPKTAFIDPFYQHPTLVLTCDVLEPTDGKPYERDPRSIARRAEAYLKASGIGETAYFGPEPEFYVFDGVSWDTRPGHSFYALHSREAPWSSRAFMEGKNPGHRPGHQGGYMPVAPMDHGQDMRAEMVLTLQSLGIPVEVFHHEVGGAGQMEIGTRFGTLLERADWTQRMKYVIWNVAARFGRTATFMAKPYAGDSGSGMHVHQSIWQAGKNLFAGDGYAGLSEMAMYYIGGLIHHAPALNAITNPTTNSYRRLVPNFEAPVKLAYSSRNRSASIRIPHVSNDKARRVEVRFPDPMANPYLCFAALLMAGLDGIENKIDPGEAASKDLYHLPPEEDKQVPTVCSSLGQALEALDNDRAFLLKTGVFSESMLDAYIDLKQAEVDYERQHVSPVEYEMYYSL